MNIRQCLCGLFDSFQVNWLVDNLPAAMKYQKTSTGAMSYTNGFPVGLKIDGRQEKNSRVYHYMRLLSDVQLLCAQSHPDWAAH